MQQFLTMSIAGAVSLVLGCAVAPLDDGAADAKTESTESALRAPCGLLYPGESLPTSASLRSCDGRSALVNQADGNVVLVDTATGAPLWDANSALGARTIFSGTVVYQGDGNLVNYDVFRQVKWSIDRQAAPGVLAMQDDCNLVAYDASGRPYWWTGTSNRCGQAPRWKQTGSGTCVSYVGPTYTRADVTGACAVAGERRTLVTSTRCGSRGGASVEYYVCGL